MFSLPTFHDVHLALHVILPGVVARLGWKRAWRRTWLWLLLANLVDLDHLLARPMYDPDRCSIGFHPLHSWPAAALYAILLLHARTRIAGVGLLLHLALDGLDCLFMHVR